MKTLTAILLIAALSCGALFAGDETAPQKLSVSPEPHGILHADEATAPPEFFTSAEPREAWLDEMFLAGFQVLDTMEQDSLMQVWEKLFSLDEEIPHADSLPYYGVSFVSEAYDPAAQTGYGYMAGLPVEADVKLPENAVLRRIPAQHYLVFEHRGPLSHLQESFNYIWLKFNYGG